MEQQMFTSDFSNVHLEILAVQENLLNVERGHRCTVDLLPRILHIVHKVQIVSEKLNFDFAKLVKGLYNVIALVFSQFTHVEENNIPVRTKIPLIVKKQQILSNGDQNFQHDEITQQQKEHQYQFSRQLSHLQLQQTIGNDYKIRKEMESFIKCINNIEQNSQNFLKEILLSHEAHYEEVETIDGLNNNVNNKLTLLKEVSEKYHLLVSYFKTFSKKFDETRETYAKQKQGLISTILKQHQQRLPHKKNPLRTKVQEKQTQTRMTSDDIESLEYEIQKKNLEIQFKDKQIKMIMQQLYDQKTQIDSEQYQKQTKDTIVKQKAQMISSLQDNFLQMCQYAAELEISHVNLNDKIDKLGALGLEEYVDEKEFSSFTMDFKISLFNIFRKIITKYAKANEESKQNLAAVGRRGGISGIRYSGTINNFGRISSRTMDPSMFNTLIAENKAQKQKQQKQVESQDDSQIGKDSIKQSKRLKKIRQQKDDYQQGSFKSQDEQVINQTIVKQTKRGFVSTILKKHIPELTNLNTHASMRVVINSQQPKSPKQQQQDQIQTKKKKPNKSLSNIKWKFQQQTNKQIHKQLQNNLTSKFQVVENSIHDMNMELLHSQQKAVKRKTQQSINQRKSVLKTRASEMHKSSKNNQVHKTNTEHESPNKMKRKIKSILTKTAQWGLRKTVKSLMTQQAQEILLNQKINNENVSNQAKQKRSRFSQFPMSQNLQTIASAHTIIPKQRRVSNLLDGQFLSSRQSRKITKKISTLPNEIIQVMQGRQHEQNKYIEDLDSDDSNYEQKLAQQQNRMFSQSVQGERRRTNVFKRNINTSNPSQQINQSQSQNPLLISKTAQFSRIVRNSKSRKPFRQLNLTSTPQQSMKVSKHNRMIHQFINKLKLRSNIKLNKALINQIKQLFNSPNYALDKKGIHNIDLDALVDQAQKIHLQKCGSMYCTHLLKFYETIRRLASEIKPKRQQISKNIWTIDVIDTN